MPNLTRHVVALAIVSTLSLAGCGGSDSGGGDAPKSAATSSSPSAEGKTIKGTGYTYQVPKGWDVPSADTPGTAQADSFAGDLTDKDGFTDNVNVILDNTVVGIDRAQLESSVEKVLTNAKATDIKIKDPVTIAGDESFHVGAAFQQSGVTYRTEQYAASHDGKGFIITFSFSDSVAEADRDARAAAILATWKWTA